MNFQLCTPEYIKKWMVSFETFEYRKKKLLIYIVKNMLMYAHKFFFSIYVLSNCNENLRCGYSPYAVTKMIANVMIPLRNDQNSGV